MTQTTAPILDTSGNFAVIQMPGRRFPAVAIPGDSLHTLCDDLSELVQGLANALGPEHEQVECAQAILQSLEGRRDYYESVLKRAGIALPYLKGP